MSIEVKVPVLPESVAEATLVNWHKKVGDVVNRDENLVDVETDKVVLELPSPTAGVLTEIRKPDGATVMAQEVIAVIDPAAKGAAAPPAAAAAPPAAAATPAAAAAPAGAAAPPAPAAAPSTVAASGPAAGTALPAARKLMADQNVNPSDVAGTGRGGRITKGDVLAAVETRSEGGKTAAAVPAVPRPATPAPTAPPPAPQVVLPAGFSARPEQRVPMSRLRQRVAERLVASQHTAAILTTFNEVNMTAVIELRNRYKERFEKEHGVKLGFMGFFVKAAVHALKKFPIVNASIDGTDIVYHGYFDIGIAVGSPRGLVVPIVRDADQLTIAEIEQQI